MGAILTAIVRFVLMMAKKTAIMMGNALKSAAKKKAKQAMGGLVNQLWPPIERLKKFVINTSHGLQGLAVFILILAIGLLLINILNAFLSLFAYEYAWDFTKLESRGLEEEPQNQEALYRTYYDIVSETSYYQAFNTADTIASNRPANVWAQALLGATTIADADKKQEEIINFIGQIFGLDLLDYRSVVHDANLSPIDTLKKAAAFSSVIDFESDTTYFRDYYNRENNFVLSPGLLKELNDKVFNQGEAYMDGSTTVYPESFTKPIQFVKDYFRVQPIDAETAARADIEGIDVSWGTLYVRDYVYRTRRLLDEDIRNGQAKITNLDNYMDQLKSITDSDYFTGNIRAWEGTIISAPTPYIYENIVLSRNEREVTKSDSSDLVKHLADNNIAEYVTVYNQETKSMEYVRLYWMVVMTGNGTHYSDGTVKDSQNQIRYDATFKPIDEDYPIIDGDVLKYYGTLQNDSENPFTEDADEDDIYLVGPFASYKDMISGDLIDGSYRPLENTESLAQIKVSTYDYDDGNGEVPVYRIQYERPIDVYVPSAGQSVVGATTTANTGNMPADWVYLTDVLTNATYDIRYATTDNFTGGVVPGYSSAQAIMDKSAAEKLKKVEDSLAAKGYKLVIYDAYQPYSATEHFSKWVKSETGSVVTSAQNKYFPGLSLANIISDGYVKTTPSASPKNKGAGVSVGLMTSGGSLVDMGTTFDMFSPMSRTDNESTSGLTSGQKANRKILRDAMTAEGFTSSSENWWYFKTSGGTAAAQNFAIKAPTVTPTPSSGGAPASTPAPSISGDPNNESIIIKARVSDTFPRRHYQLVPLTDEKGQIVATSKELINVTNFSIRAVRDTYRRTAEYQTELQSFMENNKDKYGEDSENWWTRFWHGAAALFGNKTVTIPLNTMADAILDFEQGCAEIGWDGIANRETGFGTVWEYAQTLEEFSDVSYMQEGADPDPTKNVYSLLSTKARTRFISEFKAAVSASIPEGFFSGDWKTDWDFLNSFTFRSTYLPSGISASYDGSAAKSPKGDAIWDIGTTEAYSAGGNIFDVTGSAPVEGKHESISIGEMQLVSTLSQERGYMLSQHYTGVAKIEDCFLRVIDTAGNLTEKGKITAPYEFRNTDSIVDLELKRFKYPNGTIIPLEVRSVRDYGLASIIEYVEGLKVTFKKGIYYDEGYNKDGVKAFMKAYGESKIVTDKQDEFKKAMEGAENGYYPKQLLSKKAEVTSGSKTYNGTLNDDFIRDGGGEDAALAIGEIVAQQLLEEGDMEFYIANSGGDTLPATVKKNNNYSKNADTTITVDIASLGLVGGMTEIVMHAFTPFVHNNGQFETYNNPMKFYTNWFVRGEKDEEAEKSGKLGAALNSVIKFITNSGMTSQDDYVGAIHDYFYGSGSLTSKMKDDFKGGLKGGDLDNGPYNYYVLDHPEELVKKFGAALQPFKYIEDDGAEHMYLIEQVLTFLGRFDYTYKDSIESLGPLSNYDSKRIIGMTYADRFLYIDEWEAKKVGWTYASMEFSDWELTISEPSCPYIDSAYVTEESEYTDAIKSVVESASASYDLYSMDVGEFMANSDKSLTNPKIDGTLNQKRIIIFDGVGKDYDNKKTIDCTEKEEVTSGITKKPYHTHDIKVVKGGKEETVECVHRKYSATVYYKYAVEEDMPSSFTDACEFNGKIYDGLEGEASVLAAIWNFFDGSSTAKEPFYIETDDISGVPIWRSLDVLNNGASSFLKSVFGTSKLGFKDTYLFPLKKGHDPGGDVDLDNPIKFGEDGFKFPEYKATALKCGNANQIRSNVGKTDWSYENGGGCAVRLGGESKDMREIGEPVPLYRVYSGENLMIYPKEFGSYFEGELYIQWVSRVTLKEGATPEEMAIAGAEKARRIAYFEAYLYSFETYIAQNIKNDSDVTQRIGLATGQVNPTALAGNEETVASEASYMSETSQSQFSGFYNQMMGVGWTGMTQTECARAFAQIIQGLVELDNAKAATYMLNKLVDSRSVEKSNDNKDKIVAFLKYTRALEDAGAVGSINGYPKLKTSSGGEYQTVASDWTVLGWGFINTPATSLNPATAAGISAGQPWIDANNATSVAYFNEFKLEVSGSTDDRLSSKSVAHYYAAKFMCLMSKYNDVNTTIIAMLLNNEAIMSQRVLQANGSKVQLFNPTDEQLTSAITAAGLTVTDELLQNVKDARAELVLAYVKNPTARQRISETYTTGGAVQSTPTEVFEDHSTVKNAMNNTFYGKSYYDIIHEAASAGGMLDYFPLYLATAQIESSFNAFAIAGTDKSCWNLGIHETNPTAHSAVSNPDADVTISVGIYQFQSKKSTNHLLKNKHDSGFYFTNEWYGDRVADASDNDPRVDVYRATLMMNYTTNKKMTTIKDIYKGKGVSNPSDELIILGMVESHNIGEDGFKKLLNEVKKKYGDASMWPTVVGTDKELWISTLESIGGDAKAAAQTYKTMTKEFKDGNGYVSWGNPFYIEKFLAAYPGSISFSSVSKASGAGLLDSELKRIITNDYRKSIFSSVSLVSYPFNLQDIELLYTQATSYKIPYGEDKELLPDFYEFNILNLLGNSLGGHSNATVRMGGEGEHPGIPYGLVSTSTVITQYAAQNDSVAAYIAQTGHFGDKGGIYDITNVTAPEMGVVGPAATRPVYYFSQYDGTFGTLKYASTSNPASTITAAGCGPSSSAIIFSTLLGTVINPPEMALFSLEVGGRAASGSFHSLSSSIMKKLNEINPGAQITERASSKANILQDLEDDYMIIMSGKGAKPFSEGGHFITVVGYRTGEDGKTKLLIANPAYTVGVVEYDKDFVMKQDINSYKAFTAPLIMP